jgi:hypothetical protein
MYELLNNSSLIFWGSVTLMVTVPSIAYYWYKIRKAELDHELKREMIQRGMSAEEICQVMRASSRRERNDESVEAHE